MARPKPVLTKEQIVHLENMAHVGLTIEQMAPLLDLTPRTLERMLEQNPEYSGALKKGRSKAIFQVGKSAYQQAVSGKVPAMTMFYLKCRAGWKEHHAVEISGPEGKPIETKSHSDLTDEELNAKIQRLIAKAKPKEKQ